MKQPSLASLRRKLDKVFAAYIREQYTNAEGMGFCITCKQYAKLQCGHFIKRQHMAVRWDERNVAGQCLACNHFKGGNEGEFYHALLKKYGQDTMFDLMNLKRKTVHHTRADLMEMIERFKS